MRFRFAILAAALALAATGCARIGDGAPPEPGVWFEPTARSAFSLSSRMYAESPAYADSLPKVKWRKVTCNETRCTRLPFRRKEYSCQELGGLNVWIPEDVTRDRIFLGFNNPIRGVVEWYPACDPTAVAGSG